jgi:hypothetical protein
MEKKEQEEKRGEKKGKNEKNPAAKNPVVKNPAKRLVSFSGFRPHCILFKLKFLIKAKMNDFTVKLISLLHKYWLIN